MSINYKEYKKLMVQKKSKYKSQRLEVDGYKFDSKKEANRYLTLTFLQKIGRVKYFHRQVPFDIGGGAKYKIDFLVFWSTGEITYEDVKGYQTAGFKLKKKLVEEKYPVKITLI